MRNSKLFIINLNESKDRRAWMEAQMKLMPEMDFEFFPAIRGSQISSKELLELYDEDKSAGRLKRKMSSGEIGIAISQISVYKRIVELDLEYAIILEDDTLISPYFSEVVEVLQNYIVSSIPQIILLTPTFAYTNKKTLIKGQNRILVSPWGDYHWAAGYIINKIAAKVLAENLLPIFTVADDWKFMKKSYGIEVRAVHPYVVSFSRIGGQWNSIIDEQSERKDLWTSYKRNTYSAVIKVLISTIFSTIRRCEMLIKRVKTNKEWMWDYNGIRVPKF